MRKKSSYVKKYGPAKGAKLYRLLQTKSAVGRAIDRLKKSQPALFAGRN